MTQACDAVLLRALTGAPAAPAMAALGALLRAALACPDAVLRVAHAPDPGLLYLYLEPGQRLQLDTPAVLQLQSRIAQRWPEWRELEVSRLEKVFELAGAACGAAARFHYVVEMDPEAGWMPDLVRWYDQEHMPGLAAVPGCIRAQRFLNHDHSPLSLACYDLVSAQTKGCAPWLAITHTEWSSRMRPHFTNPRRTMFQMLASAT